VADLMEAMVSAAKRGVQVRAIIDAHCLMVDDFRPGPLWLWANPKPEQYHGSFKAIREALQDLRQAGGTYSIANHPAKRFSNPYAGRSHIKLALVNNLIFLGGCNFQHPEQPDIMVSWSDYATADWLRVLAGRIADAPSALLSMEGKDVEHRVADNATIFVDASLPKQSVILRQAYQLIDEAQESLAITCQYFPGGETAQRLLAAHRRGVKVRIYYSPPVAHGFQAPAHWFYNHLERRKLPPEFFAHEMPSESPKLHAKILLSEKSVMIGSHNYVQAGVNLGTAEIALRVDGDTDLNKRVTQHIFTLVA
jgi:phosphatidylserine/phosphatidylglycerophosphate/cardiolipin synthase-like enzyme